MEVFAQIGIAVGAIVLVILYGIGWAYFCTDQGSLAYDKFWKVLNFVLLALVLLWFLASIGYYVDKIL